MNRLRVLFLPILALLVAVSVSRGQTYETLFVEDSGHNPCATLVQGSDGAFYGTTQFGGASNLGVVFKVTPSGELTTLVSFNGVNGSTPRAGVVDGSDGVFYGTTERGGADDRGTVFKVTPSGELTTLVSFGGANGSSPHAKLVKGSDGAFYGTTYSGGARGGGTVFKITPEGLLTTLVSFSGANGSSPHAELVEGSDGAFYGTTYFGGAHGAGTVFKITPEGLLTTLVSFNSSTNSTYPQGMVEGSDGAFYGTTAGGGAGNLGTVFKVTPSGELTTLVSFNGSSGSSPYAGLIEGGDGAFYGTTTFGGANNVGTVFKIMPTGELTTLVSVNTTTGRSPYAGLIEGSDGAFYTTTYVGGADDVGTIIKVTPTGELTTLASLRRTNGYDPNGWLVEGSDGAFYGTTSLGGANREGPREAGTIFKVTPSGEFTTMVSLNGTNSSTPRAGLVKGSDGAFYGTTIYTRAGDNGTVFKVTPEGALTTLVSFKGSNGSQPYGGLVHGSDGAFYGTTYFGGANSSGTVFKVTPEGQLTTLVSFTGTNGSYPFARLVEGSDGAFYGTTSSGGVGGGGTLFKVTPQGVLTTLVSFNGTNGRNPQTELVEGSDGAFYGTTREGGPNALGTVFKVTPEGGLTTLVFFNGTNGRNPAAGLVEGSDGAFYGTTYYGGTNYSGTVFKVTPSGVLTNLHSFDGVTVANPHGTPTFGSDGNLYGTADRMVIWRISWSPDRMVTSNPADAISATGAMLHGTVTSNRATTSAWFEYGTSTAYGNKTAVQNLGAGGTSAVAISQSVTLLPHTTYYCRAVAQNSEGTTAYGEAQTFTTPNTTPASAGVLEFSFGETPTIDFDVAPLFRDVDGDVLTISLIDIDTSGKTITQLGAATFRIKVTDPIHGGKIKAKFQATDGFGGTAFGDVEIYDGTAPSITHNKPFPTVSVGADGKAALPDIRGLFTATDNIGVISFEQSPSPGTVVGPGLVSVTLTARDAASLSTSKMVELNVVDTTPPSVTQTGTLPILSVGANAKAALPDIRGLFTAADNVGVTTFLQSPSPGTVVGLGVVSVTLTASDAAYHSMSKKVVLNVIDTTPPVVSQTATLPTVSVGADGKAALPDIRELFIVTDNVGVSSFEQAPPSGTVVGVGSVSITLTARDAADLSTSKTMELNVVDTTDPMITVPAGGFSPRKFREGTPLPDYTSQVETSDNVAVAEVAQSPVAGTLTNAGSLLVTITARDSSGNTASTSFTIAGAPVDVVSSENFTKGSPVPGAGEEGSGIPAGATWNSFGVPAINDAGQVTVVGAWKSPTGSGSGIFVDERLVAKTGDPVPSFSSTTFKSIKDPVLNGAGSVAFFATITGAGVNKGNDTVLVTDAFSGQLEVVAREGDKAPEADGAKLRSFYSISLQGDSMDNAGLLFTAGLASARGSAKVTPANDLGAWLYTSSLGVSPRKVVREGDPGFAVGERIKSFQLLNTLKGSPGQGRGHYAADEVSFVTTLSSKRQALVRFSGGALEPEEITGELLGEALPEAKWQSFGLPATDRNGAVSALRAALQQGTGGVMKGNATGIFLSLQRGEEYVPVVRVGEEAFGVPGAVFSVFKDPLSSGWNSGVTFLGSIKGQGVRANNNVGIWWQTPNGWNLVARTGSQAAEVPEGARWKSFSSLALPDGERGPLFVASLAKGAGSVSANNDTGLWAVDSLGELRLLVREQGSVGEKTIKSFSSLQAVSGLPGVTRSFNNAGQLVYRAYFKDGSQGVVKVQVP